MPQFNTDNRTNFACDIIAVADEEGRALVVPILKATYVIRERGGAELLDTEEQLKVDPKGKYVGEPGLSSMIYEPETAFIKLATDVVLVGSAVAPRAGAIESEVLFRVGELRKTIKIFGDRTWQRTLLSTSVSKPEPFESIPLIWENAFGGWDRSLENPDRHTFEPRNPIGTGFRSKRGVFEDGARLPNLENPQHLLKHHGDAPPPAGFGFIGPHWQPRAVLGGTYDDAWTKTRSPLLPKNFDRRFFNAAPADQILQRPPLGGEPVLVTNTTPSGTVAFDLPCITPPQCRFVLRQGEDVEVNMPLDTIIVNTDDMLLIMLWRSHIALRRGPHDLTALEITADQTEASVR